MPWISFKQDEIAALLGAVVSREMELNDRQHDAEQTLSVRENYELTDLHDIAEYEESEREAKQEVEEIETEVDALERAATKLARVVRRRNGGA